MVYEADGLLVKDQNNEDMCFNLKCLLAIRVMNTASGIAVLWDLMPFSLLHSVAKEPVASIIRSTRGTGSTESPTGCLTVSRIIQ